MFLTRSNLKFVSANILPIAVLLMGAGAVADESVLILGAGAAGLAAAHELEELGVTNYSIVEAIEGIGGRMMNVDFGGAIIQAGANWVQGTEGSWLWELVKAGNVSGVFTNWDSAAYKYGKDAVANYSDMTDAAFEEYDEIYECMSEYADTLRESGESDTSIRQAQKLCGWKDYRNPIREFVEWFKIDFEYSENPKGTSLKSSVPTAPYVQYLDEDFFVTDSRGWLPALEQLNFDPSKIVFNTTVQEIQYGSDGATVSATTKQADGSETSVSLRADYVICTFSIGVIQAQFDTLFRPPLPDWYRQEVFKFDMNSYVKIFMRFPSNFWGEEEFYYYTSHRRAYFTLWQNLGAPGILDDGDQHILIATLTGEEAHRVERQTDEETKAEAMAVLRIMFESDDIPECTDIFVPRWLDNPLFRGSYSNWPIGVTLEDHIQMSTPNARLFISGEATHPSLPGFIHGALEEGRQTARVVKACMDDPESLLCRCAYDRKCNTYEPKLDDGTNGDMPSCDCEVKSHANIGFNAPMWRGWVCFAIGITLVV